MANQNMPLCLKRYVLMTSYIGTRYKGSQRLTTRGTFGDTNNNTIQEVLENSLESVLPRGKCRLTTGSRTDRGVHSLMSCWSLPLIDYNRPTNMLKRMANQYLFKHQHDIVVHDVLLAPADFHPRKRVINREYIFRLGVVRGTKQVTKRVASKYRLLELFSAFPANEVFRLLPVPQFDVKKAEEAVDLLRGQHDFATFSFQTKVTDDTIRDLEIEIIPANHLTFQCDPSHSKFDIYHFHFKSRAFLYNQIRRMMGAILGYASFNQINLAGIQRLLDEPDTTSWPCEVTICEPWGLYLSRMNYGKSAFQGATRTYEDGTEEEVDLFDSIPGLIDDDDNDDGNNNTKKSDDDNDDDDENNKHIDSV